MKLYLLRHGEAEDHGDSRYPDDAARPLTPKGIRRTKLLAHSLRQWEVEFDVILSSPLVRARETAEIVARGLRLGGSLEFTSYLAASGEPEKLIRQINSLRPEPQAVLLVGHEPDLSTLISVLCSGSSHAVVVMKKGGLCRLDVDQLACGRCARVEWLLPPRLLGSSRAKRRR